MAAKPMLLTNKKPLSEGETQELLAQLAQGDLSVRETLVEGHLRLVYSVVQRFVNRRVREGEDLFQVGSIGLLKAIDKFDSSFGVCFSTYAVPMIMGEIRRYLRDDNPIHVSRSLKENAVKILQYKEQLSREMDREPLLEELARGLEMSREDIVLSLDAISEPISLQSQVYTQESAGPILQDQLGDKKNTDESWLEKIAIEQALDKLKEKERRVMTLRYFHGKTQAETASEIGISQAQVSRLEKMALLHMKDEI